MGRAAKAAESALESACEGCPQRLPVYVCGAQATYECPYASSDELQSSKRLKLARALGLVEAAIVSIGIEAGGLKAMDDLLDALRELEALSEANLALAAAPEERAA